MSGSGYYQDGSWNTICYQCGFQYKSEDLRRNWQGFWTCQSCFEVRQPQDFVRALPDVQTPPWVQPRPAAVFVPRCFPNGISAIPGFAIPGCCIPGYVSTAFNPLVD